MQNKNAQETKRRSTSATYRAVAASEGLAGGRGSCIGVWKAIESARKVCIGYSVHFCRSYVRFCRLPDRVLFAREAQKETGILQQRAMHSSHHSQSLGTRQQDAVLQHEEVGERLHGQMGVLNHFGSRSSAFLSLSQIPEYPEHGGGYKISLLQGRLELPTFAFLSVCTVYKYDALAY